MASVNVGIDLGTTNTLVCTDIKGKVKCLKFKNGDGNVLPSVLYYENGEITIGKKASEDGYLNPHNVIRSSKTDMGSDKIYSIDGKVFTPVSVATEILKSVKETIYKFIKKDGYDETTEIKAVITVPAYFQGNQYDATKRAALAAGFKEVRIITEPTAAAISYITESADDLEDKKLLVVDIGGGTFDLSYLQYNSDRNEYETLAVDGDKKLGGDDFDECVRQAMVEMVEADTNLDLSTLEKSGLPEKEYNQIKSKLLRAARRIKIDLTDTEDASAIEPDLFKYKNDYYTFDVELTRDEFNEICKGVYDKIFTKFKRFMDNNNITPESVWRVALAGGSCSIPYIGEKIEEIFPGKVYSDLDLATLVVRGAYTVSSAIYGGMSANKPVITDILSHSLGVKADGKFSEMLPRGSKYPTSYTRTFSTSKDNQKSVNIEIYETKDIANEDRRDLSNSELLSCFALSNIRKGKKGEVKIDVTFEYDESRILKVSAVDQFTHAHEEIVIEYDKHELQKKLDAAVPEPMNIFLSIDTSGSMRGRNLDNAKKAAKNIVNNVVDLSYNKIGIAEFGYKTGVDLPLSNNVQQLNDVIENLYASGGTPLSQSLDTIRNEFKKGENNFVIILTDGAPDSMNAAKTQADKLKSDDVTVISVGTGLNSRTKEFLREISSRRSNGEPYLWLTDDVDSITEIFEQIIGEISEL